MLWICKNADCAGNFSFNYFYVFLDIKFIVNIQTEIFDVWLNRDQWLTKFNRIIKHRFFFGRDYHGSSFTCIYSQFICKHPLSCHFLTHYRVSSKSDLCAFMFEHVSSAYKTEVDLKWLKMLLTHIEKSIGPRVDPCGTPDFTTFTDE